MISASFNWMRSAQAMPGAASDPAASMSNAIGLARANSELLVSREVCFMTLTTLEVRTGQ
jgi:hypothetical protein